MEIPNRINVATSRVKRFFIMVGDFHSIVNATTKAIGGEKAALQHYLEGIKPEWVVPVEKIQELFR
jgi:hypothetical protein